MLNVFQKLQFTVSSFRQHGRAEGLHNLLHRDGDACKLVLCGTIVPILSEADKRVETTTNQTRPNAPRGKVRIRTEDSERVASRTHSNGLEVNISSGDLKKNGKGGQESAESPSDLQRKLASKEVPKMESLTKDIVFKKSDELGGEEEAQRTGKGRT